MAQYEMSLELRQEYAAFQARIPYNEQWYRQRQWGMGPEFAAFRLRDAQWERQQQEQQWQWQQQEQQWQCQESGNGSGSNKNSDKNSGKIEQRQCDKMDKAAGVLNKVYQ